MLDLPSAIANACSSLFETVPFEESMSRLTGSSPDHVGLVEETLNDPALAGCQDLAAGLWLYVDDLDRSHTIAQGIESATGAYWHGIMHRREGDYSNSHHWMRRAAEHPLLKERPELDPDGLIDAVAAATRDDPALVQRQREEWQALFEWCAAQGAGK